MPGFKAGFMVGFNPGFKAVSMVAVIVLLLAQPLFLSLPLLVFMFGIAVLRLPASRMVSFYRSAKCLFACLLVAIGLLQQSAVAG